jgi:hypothetical protein
VDEQGTKGDHHRFECSIKLQPRGGRSKQGQEGALLADKLLDTALKEVRCQVSHRVTEEVVP